MKHKFSKNISSQLKPLLKLNNYSCFVSLFYDYLIIAIAIILSLKISYFFYPITILLIGSRMRALATLFHDSIHFRLCKNKYLNKILGQYFAAMIILQDFETYYKSHSILHHQKLGSLEDPDLIYYKQQKLYANKSTIYGFFNFIILPLLGSKTVSFVKYLLKNRLLKINEKDASIFLAFWFCTFLFLSLKGWFIYLVLFWLIPFLYVFPMIGWFIEIAEHYPLVGHEETRELYKTRNRYSSFIEGFLTGIHGEKYHLTHHLNPAIPYYNIKKAHKIMLQDKKYFDADKKNGMGIFLPSKNRSSVVGKYLLKKEGEI